MIRRRREWFDPMRWPVPLRWVLFVPVALAVAAFVVFVYGTIDGALNWAPRYIMRSVLAACASIALIFSAAYVVPDRKRLVALAFAFVPLLMALTHAEPTGFLRPSLLTSVGYVAGTFIGLFIVFTYRSEASVLYEERRRSPVPPSFPHARGD